MAISKVDTRNTIAPVWLIRCTCAQPYHPSNIKQSRAAVLALLGLMIGTVLRYIPGWVFTNPIKL